MRNDTTMTVVWYKTHGLSMTDDSVEVIYSQTVLESLYSLYQDCL